MAHEAVGDPREWERLTDITPCSLDCAHEAYKVRAPGRATQLRLQPQTRIIWPGVDAISSERLDVGDIREACSFEQGGERGFGRRLLCPVGKREETRAVSGVDRMVRPTLREADRKDAKPAQAWSFFPERGSEGGSAGRRSIEANE